MLIFSDCTEWEKINAPKLKTITSFNEYITGAVGRKVIRNTVKQQGTVLIHLTPTRNRQCFKI